MKLRAAVEQADALLLVVQDRFDAATLEQIRRDLLIQLRRWWWYSDGTASHKKPQSTDKAEAALRRLDDLWEEMNLSARLAPASATVAAGPSTGPGPGGNATARQPAATHTPPTPSDLIPQTKAAEVAEVSDDTIGRRIADGTLTGYGEKNQVSLAEVQEKKPLMRKQRHPQSNRKVPARPAK